MDALNLLVPFVGSPSNDLVTNLFESANKVTDLVIAFYLSNPRTFFAIVLCTIFLIYYIRNVVQKPILFCAEGRFRWFIKANCTTINENYWPTIWCYETHIHTPLANFLRGLLPELKYHREYIRTPDGGQISLDWYDPDASNQECRLDSKQPYSNCESKIHSNYDKPIALFLPGITGCSQAEYLKTLVPLAHNLGYRAVAINYRGLGNTQLLTPRLYCAANDEDLRTALKHIRRSNPNSKIVATGISLGGIILARYLISSGYDALVDAAFLVSVCWDFMYGCASMEKGLNYALNQHLTRALIGIVMENRHLFDNMVDIEHIQNCRDIREFDEAFTIRMFNFESVKEYYCESSHKGKIACIKKPTFCINAADDMFAPVESLPVDEVEQSSHVAMLVTSRGGHIGFMEGIIPKFRHAYYSERVIEQYLKALYDLPDVKRDLF
ncbi:hypothetical protein RDWZM_000752 [Blomia tropicalis]|uniref:AB hydrolase-1 domain-containing protein n=1 Tax=Blomia tropicalis TaxID=40697 RepID=A0A9Q0MCZ6_BLOTA|nr:hypothetical protein RDWZM_000752 [Blomia tropicalis]